MQKALREVENFAIHLAQTIQNTILRKLIKKKWLHLYLTLISSLILQDILHLSIKFKELFSPVTTTGL